MIGKLLSGYIQNKLVEEQSISVISRRCINTLQKRQHCNLCLAVCNEKAVTVGKIVTIDNDACTHCGLCVSVCPTHALALSLKKMEALYNRITKAEHLLIACSQHQLSSVLTIDCLVSLPWELLAYAAMDRTVYLPTYACSRCQREDCCQAVQRLTKQLRQFFDSDGHSGSIVEITEVENLPQLDSTSYSRREMFAVFAQGSKSFWGSVIPTEETPKQLAALCHDLLVQKVEQAAQQQFGWNGLSVSKGCYGCGVCATICPLGAISIEQDEQRGRWLKHSYTKCTHCGLCRTVCLENAVSMVVTRQPAGSGYQSHHITSVSCTVCKKAMKPEQGELCVTCYRKQKTEGRM